MEIASTCAVLGPRFASFRFTYLFGYFWETSSDLRAPSTGKDRNLEFIDRRVCVNRNLARAKLPYLVDRKLQISENRYVSPPFLPQTTLSHYQENFWLRSFLGNCWQPLCVQTGQSLPVPEALARGPVTNTWPVFCDDPALPLERKAPVL